MSLIMQSHGGDSETIIQRLKVRIEHARDLGFQVRNEWLDGLDSPWCELGGVRILFIDLSRNAHEQLDQVNAAIDWHHQQDDQVPAGDWQPNRAA